MKLLLTSAGISNDSIRIALEDLLGKPIAESTALCIPTATYSISDGPAETWRQICSWSELGWKTFGMLELTALSGILQEHWLPHLKATDALLVNGGESFYLCYWMWQSGLADLLPSLLQDVVYVGASAGSVVVTQTFRKPYDGIKPPIGSDKALGLVDFTLRPHLNADYAPTVTLASIEQWASSIAVPVYALDDQSAIKVIDGEVSVVSEGQWKRFAH